MEEDHQEREKRNTITQQKGNRFEDIKRVYQWACKLTAEQGEKAYLQPPEFKMVLTRLLTTTGNMIAVIGLQGVGKTAFREKLSDELRRNNKVAYSMKWKGDFEKSFSDAMYWDEGYEWDDEYTFLVMDELEFYMDYNAERIIEKLKIDPYSALAQEIRKPVKKDYWTLSYLVPQMERLLGQKRVKELRRRWLLEKMRKAHTILIDLPDYDRNNISQMLKDLTSIQRWWEGFCKFHKTDYEQNVNLVLFIQKELFRGHFFLGKFDVYEIKPFTPKMLTEFYEAIFGSSFPFTEEALREIAVLSRGVFRRFKKYIRICLDRLLQSGLNIITLENVRQWITLDQLVKDMELELMTIFPKEREHRILSVKLLRLLREKGPLTQSQITKEIFDGAAMKASRVLGKLEAWGYIKRERKGKDKIVYPS